MMKELSKTGYSLAVTQAIALRMAFACWLLFMTFPMLAQEHSVSLHLNHVSLLEAINEIKRQSNLNLMYSDEDVKSVTDITVNVDNVTPEVALTACLNGTNLVAQKQNGVFVIHLKKTEKKIKLTGKVMDSKDGSPLAGATVFIMKNGKYTVGTAATIDGNFSLEIPAGTKEVVASYIGYKNKYVKVDTNKPLQIFLEENSNSLNEVVVNGYSSVKRTSFTGNAVTVTKDDLLKVSSRNMIDVLQVYDPSLRIATNNEMGSDPNSLPEFYIRGRSGVGVMELDKEALSQSSLSNNPNTPIFIMDGYEVSVSKVYDFDPNRIERITILKDAAATAIYGSRAANGVIVIETKAPVPGKLRINYNFTAELTAPDTSDYNLMNASEKLEAERLADLYKSDSPGTALNLQKEYLAKQNNILKGIDTDWIAQPLRNGFNHKHSLYVEGGVNDIRFGAEMSYDNQNGVMKGSYRRRVGGGFYVDYRINNLQIKNYVTFNSVKSENSPYGNFSEYTSKQPYDSFMDEEGNYVEYLTMWHTSTSNVRNPLYDAYMLNSYDRSSYTDLTNNLSLNYRLAEVFQLKAQFSITKRNDESRRFTDPGSGKFVNYSDNEPKGELALGNSQSVYWNANVLANYVQTVNRNHMNFSLGLNMRETRDKSDNSLFLGFPSGHLDSPNYADKIDSKPSFSDNHTRLMGSFLSTNYTYDNIYLMDASFRMDGSSEFGSKKKFAPFWSFGAGLNIHNYPFMKAQTVFSQLKVRGSYGQIGKVNFPAYVAKHTYRILTDTYGTGNGVLLYYMGNEDLKWEKTNTFDIGADVSLFHDAVIMRFSWYNKKTVDLITDVTLPSSTGFTVYRDNLGEVQNRGVELDIRADVYKDRNWTLTLFGNLAHNKNKILKISESLKAYNERVDKYFEEYNKNSGTMQDSKYSRPFMKYMEGGSLTSIWGMRSLGINPSDGQETFQKKDGTITADWNSSDQVIIGNTEPKVQGAFGVNLRYKQFTMYATFKYECGGQLYNSTLVNKVENVNIYEVNADRRVLTDRWTKPGDVTMLKSIKDRYHTTRPTSRFVQDNNTLEFNSFTLAYDFSNKLLAPINISMLRLQFNMNNIAHISSIRQERGLSYPYARTFSFSVNLGF